MDSKGLCLQERALIQMPDGSTRCGSIWKHTQGVQAIYAIVPDEEGILIPYALVPEWKVRAGEDGRCYLQGLGSGTWLDRLDEWWTRIKFAFTKGRTRIRKLNLA